MNRRPAMGLIVLIVLLCFIGGLLSMVVQRGIQETPREADLASGEAPPLEIPETSSKAQQITTLVIGVKDFVDTGQILRAVWILTVRIPEREVFAQGVPLNRTTAATKGATLEEAFHFDAHTGPDSVFLSAAQEIAQTTFEVVVVLDEIAFETVIDYLGGVDLNGEGLSGSKVTGFLSMLQDDPSTSLQLQARILEALSLQITALGASPELTPLLSLAPNHAYSSVRPLELVGMFSPLLPLEDDKIHVVVPMD